MFEFLFRKRPAPHVHQWTEIGFAHLWRNCFYPGEHRYSKTQCKNYGLPVSVKTFKCHECGNIDYDVAHGHVARWPEPLEQS